MPDLNFRVDGAEPERYATAPQLLFRLRVAETGAAPGPVHSVLLRCQVRIEPGRRRYSAREQERLLDLFGTPDRWGQTVRGMLWAHVTAVVPAFSGETTAGLPVPCGYDFALAATRYFDALEGGDVPLLFLFSGTVFYESADGLRVAQIPWEKEASYRLSADVWRGLVDHYYPNTAWLGLRKDVFDRLGSYKSRHGLPTWEQAVERLLAAESGPFARS